MPLVAEVALALREETPSEKAYVAVFSEVVPHFHVHVIARPPALPRPIADLGSWRGPPVDAREAEDVTGRVLARLEGTAARPGRGRGRSPRSARRCFRPSSARAPARSATADSPRAWS